MLKGGWFYPEWVCSILLSVETAGKYGGIGFITVLAIDRLVKLSIPVP